MSTPIAARCVVGVLAAVTCLAGSAVSQPILLVQRELVLLIGGQSFPLQSIEAEDVDADGDLDIVAVYVDFVGFGSEGTLEWYENDAGLFIRHQILSGVDSDFWRMDVGDLDGQPGLEIALVGVDQGQVSWLSRDAELNTWTRHDLVTSPGAGNGVFTGIQIADLTGDGRSELIFGSASGAFTWMLNDGGATPAFIPNTIAGTELLSLACDDLDGDGDVDVIGARPATLWYENDGQPNPSFQLRVIDPSSSVSVDPPIVLDYNGDQEPDVLYKESASLLIYLSDGATPPSFNKVSVGAGLDTNLFFHLIDADDIDGDGDIDLVEPFAWFESDGAFPPSFTRWPLFTGFIAAGGAAKIADINGDARPDLAVSVHSTSARSVNWFEQSFIENLDTGAVFSDLDAAITASVNGETLLASPVFFESQPAIDLQSKSITLASVGEIARGEGSTTVLADGAAISTAPGGFLSIAGDIQLPAGAAASLDSDEAIIRSGLITTGAGAALTIGAPGGADVRSSFAPAGAGTVSITGDANLRGDTRFAPEPPFTTESTNLSFRRGLEAADFDEDGDPDLAYVRHDGRVVYLEHDGADPPGFTERVVAPASSTSNWLLREGDLNADGRPDLVAGRSSVSVHLNLGGAPPSFSSTTIPSSSFTGQSEIRLADLDRDGHLDVVLVSPTFLAWFESDGAPAPTFVRHDVPEANGAGDPQDVVVEDLDDDGDLDLIIPTRDGVGEVFWLESDGGSPPSFTRRSVGFGAQDLVEASVADFDGDGLLDVAASSIDDSDRRVFLFSSLGGAPPTFERTTLANLGLRLGHLQDADIDADGDIDLLASGGGGSDAQILENDGADPPTFTRRSIGIEDSTLIGVASEFVDLDRDAVQDVVMLFFEFGDLTVQWFPGTVDREEILTTPGFDLDVTGELRLDAMDLRVLSGSSVGASAGLLVTQTSAMGGVGPYNANVNSDGAIIPTPGATLAITGDLATTGEIQLDLTPLASGGQPTGLDATGVATLGGSLIARSGQPLDPLVLGSPQLLSAGSITPGSRFDVALLPNVGSDDFLSVVYTEATLRPGVDRAAATVALQVNPLSGDIELDPEATANAPEGVPRGAVVEDLDLDGDPDLVIALPDATNPTTTPGSVVVLYNADDGDPLNGWEGFGQTLQITTGVGIDPSSVAVGLVDADGQPDIVVTNRTDATLSVLLIADPDPLSFATSDTRVSAVGIAPADVILSDLDNDGFLDAAVANEGSNSITILWNSPSNIGPLWDLWPDIEPVPLPEDSECPLSIRPGDGDAQLRFLATANPGNDSIGLVQINPATRVATVLPNLPAGAEPRELIVADLDDDGQDDIATVNRAGNSVSIALNESVGGVLSMGTTSDLPIDAQTSLPISITSGDYDNDTDTDLAVLADGVVKVLRNDLAGGQLAFTPIPDQAAGTDPLLLRTGDLNVDGRDDVVTVSESTGGAKSGGAKAPGDSVSTLVAVPVPTPACAGDVNGDGTTDVFDFSDLAANFGAGPNATRAQGDLTGDGFVDVFDFSELAGDFGCSAP